MKVLLTGGSGLLGGFLKKELDTLGIDYVSPSSSECNITDLQSVQDYFIFNSPDIVIHCAAIAKYKEVELDIRKAISTNIIGTCNIVNESIVHGARMIYISSDHVFDGKNGPYNTSDKINPLTRYAKSKAAGELAVRVYDKSLVVRTSFCGTEFPFDTAYTDKWTSQDYIDKLAPKILKKCLSEETGICHVGHPRRSFYDLAKERNKNINKGSVSEIIAKSTVPILIDTSLIIER